PPATETIFPAKLQLFLPNAFRGCRAPIVACTYISAPTRFTVPEEYGPRSSLKFASPWASPSSMFKLPVPPFKSPGPVVQRMIASFHRFHRHKSPRVLL